MNKETIEGNKTIAEFMDAKFYPQWTSEIYKEPHPTFDFGDQHPTEDSSRYWSPETLQYHSSWDWLMPVAFKIKCYTVPEQSDEEDQYDLENRAMRLWEAIATAVASINIEMVWQAVIQFIQWYNNSQSKNQRP